MINTGINIFLASFNGEKFISEQLDSIINQTYTNWKLYIRDDRSSDNTLHIIKQYQEKDERVHLITDDLGNVGSCQNFSILMNSVKNENEYTMFSDQDDVWLPTKIEITLNEIQNAEKLYGKDFPLLVYTNFTYSDQQLKPIKSRTDFQESRIKVEFANILCQNHVKGCTQIINKNLVELIGTDPAEAENHDYWVALVASAFAKVIYLDKRTVLYRQHGNNISTQFDDNSFIKRFKRIVINRKNFTDAQFKLNMAIAFRNKYYKQLSDSNKKVLDDFIKLFNKKSLTLLIQNIKNGIRRQTFNQTLLFYLTLFLSKKKPLVSSMVLLLIFLQR